MVVIQEVGVYDEGLEEIAAEKIVEEEVINVGKWITEGKAEEIGEGDEPIRGEHVQGRTGVRPKIHEARVGMVWHRSSKHETVIKGRGVQLTQTNRKMIGSCV